MVTFWRPESDPSPGRRSRNVHLQLHTNLRKATKANPHFPPQGIRSAGGTLSGQPEGGSGRNRPPNKAAGGYPPAEPAAQPSIEQPHDEIEAVTQAEEPNPSGPGGVRGALPKRLTPLAVGSRAQPWSLFGYFLANQKVTPRRAGGQGIYFFSYVLPKKGHQTTPIQRQKTPCAKGQLSCEGTGF